MFHQRDSITTNQDAKTLARHISIVENEVDGFEELLMKIEANEVPVVGITGPPGAGKSTIVNALIEQIISQHKTVGVLCVDPSSPFNFGALLGDRIRMNEWCSNPNVFIRSLAARGSLGGLHPNIIEITELMKGHGFDYVFVETVGVGQSEVEIAGLADCTVVALSPEAGDDIQTMKAGIMEIADIFVVNKSDRPAADVFINNLKTMIAHSSRQEVPVIKTIATDKTGIEDLLNMIDALNSKQNNPRKHLLYAEKLYRLIQKRRMKAIDKAGLVADVKHQFEKGNFNLYDVANRYQ